MGLYDWSKLLIGLIKKIWFQKSISLTCPCFGMFSSAFMRTWFLISNHKRLQSPNTLHKIIRRYLWQHPTSSKWNQTLWDTHWSLHIICAPYILEILLAIKLCLVFAIHFWATSYLVKSSMFRIWNANCMWKEKGMYGKHATH